MLLSGRLADDNHTVSSCRFQHDMTVNLNRSATPWVIVMSHAPVYNTYQAHYKVGDPPLTLTLLYAFMQPHDHDEPA